MNINIVTVTTVMVAEGRIAVKVFVNDDKAFSDYYHAQLPLIGTEAERDEAHKTSCASYVGFKNIYFDDGRFIQVDTH